MEWLRRMMGVLLGLLLVATLLSGRAPLAAPDEGPTESDITDLKAQEASVLTELFALNREREATVADLKRLEQEQAATETQAAELQVKITQTEGALAALKQRLAGRLRLLQERGQLNPFAILLGADTLAGFLDRLESVTLLMAHDRKLMAQVTTTQRELTHQKEELRTTEQRLAALADQARGAAARLSAEIIKRESILTGLQTERGRIEAELARLETAWAEVPGLLATLAEEISTAAAQAEGFEPDEVTFSLFPPSARVIVSDDSLNRLISGKITFEFMEARARLTGDLAGAAFLLQGDFSIVDGKQIRFNPTEMRLNEVPIPSGVVDGAVAKTPIQIDLERFLTPFHMQSLELDDGKLTVRSGL